MEVFNLQLTRQQIETIGQVLSQAPYHMVAQLLASITLQVQQQEKARAQQQPSASPDDGGSSTQPGIRPKGWHSNGSSEGVQPS